MFNMQQKRGNMNIQIRREKAKDFPAIRELAEKAFAQA